MHRVQSTRWKVGRSHSDLLLTKCTAMLESLSGVPSMSDERTIKILNQLKEDLDLALIKAKAQLEYVEDKNE